MENRSVSPVREPSSPENTGLRSLAQESQTVTMSGSSRSIDREQSVEFTRLRSSLRMHISRYNAVMLSQFFLRAFSVAVGLVVVSGISLSAQDSAHRGRKYKPPPPTSRIEVTVLRDTDSKPLENASVIFHLDGEKGNMELKTNEDGKSVIDVLPTGSNMRLQIIAKGYQTYGRGLQDRQVRNGLRHSPEAARRAVLHLQEP